MDRVSFGVFGELVFMRFLFFGVWFLYIGRYIGRLVIDMWIGDYDRNFV